MNARRWTVIERDTGRPVVDRLAIADGYLSRLAGLQFHRQLPAGHGLLLMPCASVHTMCLRFALDLAMLADDGTVLAIRRNVRPWRAAVAPRGTRAVLEMSAGHLNADAGERLTIVARDGDATVPRSVSNLSRKTGSDA